jgi:hypothetical protein
MARSGWVARFYCDSTVPETVIQELKSKGSEIVRVEGMGGSIAGMFWRFLVADDPTVDRCDAPSLAEPSPTGREGMPYLA